MGFSQISKRRGMLLFFSWPPTRSSFERFWVRVDFLWDKRHETHIVRKSRLKLTTFSSLVGLSGLYWTRYRHSKLDVIWPPWIWLCGHRVVHIIIKRLVPSSPRFKSTKWFASEGGWTDKIVRLVGVLWSKLSRKTSHFRRISISTVHQQQHPKRVIY